MRRMRVVAVASLLVACGRDQIEIAEETDSADASADAAPIDARGPSFPLSDASPTDSGSCGDPPPLSQCAPCPRGYVGLPDGGASCDCCP